MRSFYFFTLKSALPCGGKNRRNPARTNLFSRPDILVLSFAEKTYVSAFKRNLLFRFGRVENPYRFIPVVCTERLFRKNNFFINSLIITRKISASPRVTIIPYPRLQRRLKYKLNISKSQLQFAYIISVNTELTCEFTPPIENSTLT